MRRFLVEDDFLNPLTDLDSFRDPEKTRNYFRDKFSRKMSLSLGST